MYITKAHAKTSIRYHIVFSTKYRKKCLDGIRNTIFDSFRYIEIRSDFKILNMNLDKDHIHFLMTWKPSISISEVINRMKQMSTNFIYEDKESCEYLRRFYWGNKRRLWSGGYFVSTVGAITHQTINNYIDKHN